MKTKKGYFLIVILLGSLVSPVALGASSKDLKKAATLNDLAVQKLKKGDVDGAEIDLLAALEYSGQNEKLKKNLGAIYFEKGVRAVQKGDFFQAQKNLKSALEIEPENARYSRALANAFSLEADARAKTGQNEEALNLYQKAAQQDPKNISAWSQAAHYAWMTQRIDLARDYLDRAKNLDAADKNVLFLEEKMNKSTPETQMESGASLHFILSAGTGIAEKISSEKLLPELEKIYDEVSYQLNFFPQNKISVVFYPVGEFHDHWKLPGRVNGYYDGKLRIPYTGKGVDFEKIKPMIKHELTHAFVSFMTRRPIPQWMNEGLAQWVEGRQLDVKSKDALVMYQMTKRVPDIDHLDEAFKGQHVLLNNTQMTLAYMKAFSLMEYLIQERGVWSVVEFAQNQTSDLPRAELFKKYFLATPQQIDERWIQWLAQKKSNYVFY